MMSALRTRRQPRSLPSHGGALPPMSREYDDNRMHVEETLEEMLPGPNVASRWVDIDDADGSAVERSFEPADADLVGEDNIVPVIPKRADEFMCSNCFLIHHISRLANSEGGQLICTECV